MVRFKTVLDAVGLLAAGADHRHQQLSFAALFPARIRWRQCACIIISTAALYMLIHLKASQINVVGPQSGSCSLLYDLDPRHD
jgi:hypothetical protein